MASVSRGAGTLLIRTGRALVAAGLRLAGRPAAAAAVRRYRERYREYEERRSRLLALGHSALPLL
ncbi:hypothetical protein LVY72_07415 [Arthrobacter sp. I2-34]|uniref:Uncharacterized protein n=1 Tax=Arthrobacter hankyongi TaxID=2904801 RepID=A0ABS9L4Z0_9MICC|nr:hypothetical protein [Arthrobacter hankyongi]MCG2621745.1 hypothetical protein [Arthrobacter hankyongi]